MVTAEARAAPQEVECRWAFHVGLVEVAVTDHSALPKANPSQGGHCWRRAGKILPQVLGTQGAQVCYLPVGFTPRYQILLGASVIDSQLDS